MFEQLKPKYFDGWQWAAAGVAAFHDRGGSLLCGHNGGVKFALLCLLTLRRCATDAADIERPKFGAL
jgi:hypothetical protein